MFKKYLFCRKQIKSEIWFHLQWLFPTSCSHYLSWFRRLLLYFFLFCQWQFADTSALACFYPAFPPSSYPPPNTPINAFSNAKSNISKAHIVKLNQTSLIQNPQMKIIICIHKSEVCFLPWKPRAAFCCTSSETAAPSTGSWDCPCARARRRGPPGRPPRSCCPASTSAAPGWPLPRCCLRSYCRGRTSRAAWTVWWWAALREYASQQLGSVPPDWLRGSSRFRWNEVSRQFLFRRVAVRFSARFSPFLSAPLCFLPSVLQTWQILRVRQLRA